MRRVTLFFLILLAAACSSSTQRPALIDRPELWITQDTPIFFGSGTSAPVGLTVTISNPSSVPVRIRTVEISSPSMSEYTLVPVRKILNQTIGPRESRSFAVSGTAVTNQDRLAVRETLLLRAIAEFTAGERQNFREVYQTVPAGAPRGR